MRILIIANGDPPDAATAQRLALQSDAIIAADGAFYKAIRLGLQPDYVTGDLDSISINDVLTAYPELRVIPTPDQERADLEKAIYVATEMGATSITVIGALGGRMDHTIANLALLSSIHTEVPVGLADSYGITRYISAVGEGGNERPTALDLSTAIGDTVSLVTMHQNTIVTITGVKWPLRDYALRPGTQGVSNVALSDHVLVTVERGALYVSHLAEVNLADIPTDDLSPH